jgi:hypothetical protein
MNQPAPGEYAPFYAGYIQACQGLSLLDALDQAYSAIQSYCEQLPPLDWDYRYAPGKWTRGQVIAHLLDGQAVFYYRAVCFARGETTPLPGFDENAFAADTESMAFPDPTWPQQWAAWKILTQALFQAMDEQRFRRIGTASGHPVSVRALGFIMAGHVLHHLHILKTRY